ncbi:MAG: hypothetical protein CMN80_05850 [Spongiibacter sp.]|nr:hypothetical protein [Spongiibacter sp.]
MGCAADTLDKGAKPLAFDMSDAKRVPLFYSYIFQYVIKPTPTNRRFFGKPLPPVSPASGKSLSRLLTLTLFRKTGIAIAAHLIKPPRRQKLGAAN